MDQPDIDYAHGDEQRVASTRQMLAITAEAQRLNLNRRLDALLVDYETVVDESGELKPDTWHILVPLFVHKYAKEQPVEPHMRVQAHMHYHDTIISRPEVRILDIPMNLWKRLPTAKSMETPEIVQAHKDREAWTRDTAMARRRIGQRGPV